MENQIPVGTYKARIVSVDGKDNFTHCMNDSSESYRGVGAGYFCDLGRWKTAACNKKYSIGDWRKTLKRTNQALRGDFLRKNFPRKSQQVQ